MRRAKRYVVDTGLAEGAARIDGASVLRDGDLLGRMLDSFVTAQLRPEVGLLPRARLHTGASQVLRRPDRHPSGHGGRSGDHPGQGGDMTDTVLNWDTLPIMAQLGLSAAGARGASS